MFLTREIPSVLGEPLAPVAIKCLSLCVEETRKTNMYRMPNSKHKSQKGYADIRSLNSNSGIKLSKKKGCRGRWPGAAAVDCCRLGINTDELLEVPPNSACLRYRFTEQVKCARAQWLSFCLRGPRAVAGHCVYAACLLSCADCQHTKSIRACKCGSQRGQMRDECASVCDSANCFEKE